LEQQRLSPGSIENYAPKLGVVGIRIEKAEFNLGDRIAYELPIEFEEQKVESLESDNYPIESAQENMLVGIKTHLTREQAKKGVRVFFSQLKAIL
jgi:hypothetical protein